MTNRLVASVDNNFTPLRLILACLVMLAHFHYLAGVDRAVWPFVYADFAVDGFFIVSGFLIYASFSITPDFTHFFTRRFFRLYPLYITVIVIQTIILLLMQDDGVSAHLHEAALYFFYNAIFMNFAQNHIGHVLDHLADPSLNPSLWTLKVEVAFYLMVPLIWLGVRRWGVGWLLVVLIGSAIYAGILRHLGQISLSRELPGALQYFIIGILSFKYRKFLQLGSSVAMMTACICMLIVTLMVMKIAPFADDHWRIVFPVLVAPIIIIFALIVPPIFVKIDLSYGIYLLHGPALQVLAIGRLLEFSLICLVGTVAIVTALAALSEYLIERPFVALGRKLSARPTLLDYPRTRL